MKGWGLFLLLMLPPLGAGADETPPAAAPVNVELVAPAVPAAASEPAPAAEAAVTPPAAAPAPTAPAAPAESVAAEPVDEYEVLEPVSPAELLTAHNAWRKRVGAPDLQWSEEAAEFAQFWADRLADNACKPEHNMDLTRRKVFGENIYNFWANRPYTGFRKDASHVVDSWGVEIKHYDDSANNCSAPPGETCGHYTQMVWARSQKVGCARAKCDAGEVWVCEYFPRGNYAGVHPYRSTGLAQAPDVRRRKLPPELVATPATLEPAPAVPVAAAPAPAEPAPAAAAPVAAAPAAPAAPPPVPPVTTETSSALPAAAGPTETPANPPLPVQQ